MGWEERRITKEVRKHDRKLYCARNKEGMLCIFRETTQMVAYDVDGMTLVHAQPTPHYVFALSDNWSTSGRPVERGVLQIMKRLHELDLWARPTLVDDLEKQFDKRKASDAKDLKNKAEALAYEMRPQFAKAFADVNTANMSKQTKFKET